LIALLGNKLVVIGLLEIPFVSTMGERLLGQLENNPKLELIIVMLVFPLIMNIFQFWLTDQFIKDNRGYIGDEGYVNLMLPEDERGLLFDDENLIRAPSSDHL
jgi:hypothetical protein